MSGRGGQPRRNEYVKKKKSLQKLMYMTVYDTLEEIFENISRMKWSWNNLYLREGEESSFV